MKNFESGLICHFHTYSNNNHEKKCLSVQNQERYHILKTEVAMQKRGGTLKMTSFLTFFELITKEIL